MEQIISNIFEQSMKGFAKVLAEHPGASSEEILSLWSQFSSGVSVQISINDSSSVKESDKETNVRKRTFSDASSEDAQSAAAAETVSSCEEPPKKSPKRLPKVTGDFIQCAFMPSRGKAAGVRCPKKVSKGGKFCCLHKKQDPSYVEKEKVVASNTTSASEAVPMSADFVVEDCEQEKTEPTVPKAASSANTVTAPKAASSVNTDTAPKAGKQTCTFIILKGESKGQLCGAVAKEGEFCARHSKISNKEPKVRTDPVVPVVAKKQDVIIVSFRKPNGPWYHKDSGFVFESDERKVVVSRMRGDKIEPITEDDVDEIMRYGFKFELPKKQDAPVPKPVVKEQPVVKVAPVTASAVPKPVPKPAVQVQILSKKNVEDIVGELLDDSNAEEDETMKVEDEEEEEAEQVEEEEELLEEDD